MICLFYLAGNHKFRIRCIDFPRVCLESPKPIEISKYKLHVLCCNYLLLVFFAPVDYGIFNLEENDKPIASIQIHWHDVF